MSSPTLSAPTTPLLSRNPPSSQGSSQNTDLRENRGHDSEFEPPVQASERSITLTKDTDNEEGLKRSRSLSLASVDALGVHVSGAAAKS